jgi:hypothetical protein
MCNGEGKIGRGTEFRIWHNSEEERYLASVLRFYKCNAIAAGDSKA